MVGKDAGLLWLHSGTQFFRRDADSGMSNLLVREWESYFSQDIFGWPIYSEYPPCPPAARPGSGQAGVPQRRLSAGRRGLDAAAAQPRRRPQQGELPTSKSFLAAGPSNVMVTAFRRKPGGQLELRAVEVDGRTGDAEITLGVPHTQAVETDLLGASGRTRPCKAIDSSLRSIRGRSATSKSLRNYLERASPIVPSPSGRGLG